MIIVNLKAENIKRVEAIDITPKDNTVVISGKNGQGKSSVLDAILYALGGSRQIEDKPIRDGETSASVTLDLGEFIVERKFSEKGSKLVVSTKEGASFGNPQEILDAMLGEITFDPLAFANYPPKHQYQSLRKLAGVDVDFDDIEKKNKYDFELRAKINRDGKELAAVVENLEREVPKDTPFELLDVAATADERARLTEQRDGKARAHTAILQLAEQIEMHQKSIAAMKEQHNALVQQYQTLPDVDQKQIDELTVLINTAQQQNNFVLKGKELAAKKERLEELRYQSQNLTNKMAARNDEAQKAIQEAKFPIEGLTIDAEGVLYKGIPFGQCSSAEKLKVSTAVAMAMNPKLRVIRIKDGALLDDDNFKILKDMATENDFQIWVERVGADPMGIIIEDGKVAHHEEKKDGVSN